MTSDIFCQTFNQDCTNPKCYITQVIKFCGAPRIWRWLIIFVEHLWTANFDTLHDTYSVTVLQVYTLCSTE